MRYAILAFLSLAGYLFGQDAAPAVPAATAEPRLALVVGVTAYDSSESSHFAPLSSPGRDCHGYGDCARGHGL